MLDKIVTVTVTQRPVASVLALVVISLFACVALTACDAAADHRVPVTSRTVPLMAALPAAPAASATVPSPGMAALREYREEADPSHAAIGSYRE
jgi:hypothetical protein